MRRPHLIGTALLVMFSSAAVGAPAAFANDSLGSPTPLAFGQPQVENNSSYGVEPGEQNTNPPFNQTCDVGRQVGVARTAWFSVQGNGATVTVSTAGSAIDTSMFVYSGSPAGALVGCSDDGPGVGINSLVTFNSVAGATYAIQAGRFCDDTFVNDCKPASPGTPPAGGALSVLATTPASAAQTGKRAAALKKCKKKTRKGSQARKKCKKRAKKLPL